MNPTKVRRYSVMLTEKDAQRIVREILRCGRDNYRHFRREHLDGRWVAALRNVPYVVRSDDGHVVERGVRNHCVRMPSHVIEDLMESEFGIAVQIRLDESNLPIVVYPALG